MVALNKLFYIAYNVLLNNILSFNTTATINGTPINMSASYQNGVLTLQGSVTIQSSVNSLTIEIYFGETLIDSFTVQAQISPGTYTLVYTLTFNDFTGIISNAIGLTVTKQLSSVSIFTNASSYNISLTQCMLTFFLEYSSYPSKISITVDFNLSNGGSAQGAYHTESPLLPQNTNIFHIVIPVTFY